MQQKNNNKGKEAEEEFELKTEEELLEIADQQAKKIEELENENENLKLAIYRLKQQLNIISST